LGICYAVHGEPRVSVPARLGGVISRLGRSLRARQVWWLAPIAIWDPVTQCIHTSRGLRKKKALDEAEARVANARSAHPGHAGLAIEYAEIATARRYWPNAAARWRAVLDLLAEAAPPDAHASLGQAYDKQQDYAAADAVLEAARRKFPDDLGIAVAYGRTATNRKDWPEAAARWQSLVKAFGSSAPAEACNGLSRAYRRQGKFAAAETARSCIRPSPAMRSRRGARIIRRARSSGRARGI
jgi:tetratricopeptide (TPR) repeat protein